jgi:hypothetical protein
LKHIAILTSGGDAPGMNAAIRAATREALARGVEVSGIEHGYAGLLAKEVRPLTARGVGGIIQRGGTMLGSARCPRFRTAEGVREGVEALHSLGIDGLEAQNVAMALVWERGALSLREIGEFFGGVNYAAVAQRIRRVKKANPEKLQKLLKEMSNV